MNFYDEFVKNWSNVSSKCFYCGVYIKHCMQLCFYFIFNGSYIISMPKLKQHNKIFYFIYQWNTHQYCIEKIFFFSIFFLCLIQRFNHHFQNPEKDTYLTST